MGVNEGSLLVVDDDFESLRLLTSILTEEGYQVRTADSGAVALASVAAAQPELILLDIDMPGTDGLEVRRRLKARDESRNIPIMFLGSPAEVSARAEGLALGGVDSVSKPFLREEVVACVRTHLELRRLRRRLNLPVARRRVEPGAAVETPELEMTERARAEAESSASEACFHALADSAPVGIWMTNRDGHVSLCSERLLTFTGRTRAELSGLVDRSLAPERCGSRTFEVSSGRRRPAQLPNSVPCTPFR